MLKVILSNFLKFLIEVEPSAPPMEDYGFVNPQESCDFVLPKQNDEISNRPFLLQ